MTVKQRVRYNTLTKAPLKPGFTQSLEALDEIVNKLKTQTLPLEEALALFEEGVGHIKICQTTLTQTQGRVEELVKTLHADGEVVTLQIEV